MQLRAATVFMEFLPSITPRQHEACLKKMATSWKTGKRKMRFAFRADRQHNADHVEFLDISVFQCQNQSRN